MEEHINVYIYPYELTSEDKLTDGPEGDQIKISEDTLLIWVDLHPEQRFVHEALYILISSAGARVEEGQWWPELNGGRILYGSRNQAAVLSPLQLARPYVGS